MLWFMTLMFMVKECLSLLGFQYFACWALDTVGVLYVHSLAEVVGQWPGHGGSLASYLYPLLVFENSSVYSTTSRSPHFILQSRVSFHVFVDHGHKTYG